MVVVEELLLLLLLLWLVYGCVKGARAREPLSLWFEDPSIKSSPQPVKLFKPVPAAAW